MKIILNENITGEGLQYLKKLENLITEFQTIDNDLKYCPNLTILNIEENEKITGCEFKHLSKLQCLYIRKNDDVIKGEH